MLERKYFEIEITVSGWKVRSTLQKFNAVRVRGRLFSLGEIEITFKGSANLFRSVCVPLSVTLSVLKGQESSTEFR